MNRFTLFVTVAVALIATGPVYGSYGPQSLGGDYAGGVGGPVGVATQGDASGYGAGPSYGSNQNIPYAPVNTRGNTVTSSITYPQNKGEILIHRPAAIIVKRPPTKVLVNHPPLVVKPAPVVLHKPPAVVMRKVFVKQHPRPVKVEPVYVNVVKPPAEKYFVNEKQQRLAAAQLAAGPGGFGGIAPGAAVAAGAPGIGLGGIGLGGAGGIGLGGAGSIGLGGLSGGPAFASAGPENAAANSGYQLLGGGQGLAALANLGNSGYAPSGGY